MNLHCTPRTSATLALAAGQAKRAASEVLGHSTPGVTQEIYQHIDDAGRQRMANAVGGLLMQHPSGALHQALHAMKKGPRLRPLLLWYTRGDSNAKPLDPQSNALSIELRVRVPAIEV